MYYKLIVILSSIFLLIGCGSSSKPTKSGEINNSGNLKNNLGYYGEGVYFAGMPVVGFWDDLEMGFPYYHIFKLKKDGDVELFDRNATQFEYTEYPGKHEYGVNEEGTVLSLYYGSTVIGIYGSSRVTIEYLAVNDWDSDRCIKTRFEHISMQIGIPEEYESYIFCRSDELNVTEMKKYWWLTY